MSELRVSNTELENFAERIGLNKVAAGRYSQLFAAELFLLDKLNGIDPTGIVDELKTLEGDALGTGTKSATEFKHEPLKGLWHQHYFSAHFVTQNILNQLSGNKMMKLVSDTFGAHKSPIATEEMLAEAAHEIVNGSMEKRADSNKLTGEWIIFGKYEGQNYYLSLATHSRDETEDQMIYNKVKRFCYPQFPFLAKE